MQVETSAGRTAASRSSAASLYLVSWLAVASVGLGYIALATARPDILVSILPIAEPASEQAASVKGNDELTEEIAALRKWIHELQHELAATRSTLQDQVAHSGAVVQRLAAAEERLATLIEVRDTQPPAGRGTVQRVPGRAQAPAASPARTAQAAPAEDAAPAPAVPAPAVPAVANLNVINGATASIATGSVPSAPPTAPSFGPARVVPAPANQRAIEIGAGESLDNLRAKWGELSRRDAQTLGALSPRYRLSADGRAAPFTLLAGPFDNSAEANRACSTLRTKGISCRVGAYAGNAL
jgi:hypothetical protein